jgi:hypothetical protein
MNIFNQSFNALMLLKFKLKFKDQLMKRTLVSLFFISFSFGANAQGWFNVQANCSVSRAAAQCTVYNRFYRPLTCRVDAAAMTFYGVRGAATKTIIIAPGFVDGVSVYALNPQRDPIVRANASAYCRF